MIKTKTLFILGAGASVPYKYLTSVELRYEILFNAANYEVDIVDALNPFGDDVKDFHDSLIAFREAFSKSGRNSIDSFLEHRPEFMEIGKTFIAKILISYEKDNNLRNNENNWYMYLLERMEGSFDELSQNKISFITFNYDRSLEYFLFEAIKNQFNKTPTECTEMMRNFPIVHLYGQLDPLPWQDKNGKEYSSTKNLTKRLRAAPKNIKLISDERDIEKSQEFQNAYKLVECADRIFFLGFSFDKTNLERLKIRVKAGTSIVGTAYNLETTKRIWVDGYFRKKIQVSISLGNDNIDALSLLKEHLRIE